MISNNTFSLSSSAFESELLSISTDIVWKNQTLAQESENDEYSIEVEQYMLAMKGMLTFEVVYQFAEPVLRSLNIFTDEQIYRAMDNKSTIPDAYRSILVEAQREYIISEYVEYNNYYRMLYGLPEIGDTEFFYNTQYPDISGPDIPVHKLSITARITLEAFGYFEELLKDNPSKKYLKYLGKRNINPYIARSSDRFAILYINESEYKNLNTDFIEVYNEAKHMVNNIYYSAVYKQNNPYYDGFMAMCILFMAIQLMHYRYLDADITRDFYDLESIRYVYESYGVPFYSSIPIQYHKNIIKNINRLLSYKGSTRVFFELFTLFEYNNVDIYQYYLMKTHKTENGRPVFVKDLEGNLDIKSTYDLKFGKVRLYDDPPLELSDPGNHIPYNDLIREDPFWISDSELIDTLYSEEFNYIETKYMGIQTVFDIIKIMYESTFFFKLIQDNRTSLINTSIYLNSLGGDVNIFTLCIYAAAVACRNHGYDGSISTALPTISKVMGFNFKENLVTLKEKMLKDKYLSKDTELLNRIAVMNVDSLESINIAFSNITAIKDHLVKKMSDTHEKKEYFAYYELYNTLMYSEYIETVFKKSNGKIATSFEDLLSDLNSDLYVRLQSVSDLSQELTDILILMKNEVGNLRYLDMIDGLDINSVIDHLFKMLEYFKSAKATLTGYNIIYTLSSKSENTMKLIAEIKEANVIYEEIIKHPFRKLTDKIAIYKLKVDIIKDKIDSMQDELKMNGMYSILTTHFDILTDKFSFISHKYSRIDNQITHFDYMELESRNRKLNTPMVFTDYMITNYSKIVE